MLWLENPKSYCWYDLKEEYFWCNRLPILSGLFPRSRGCFQIYSLTSPEYSYAPILVKNESVGVVTNILKLFARPFCIGFVALLWRKAKHNVNPGLSYLERCSLACMRLLANLHLHFAIRQSKATLPFRIKIDLIFELPSFVCLSICHLENKM